MLPDEVVAAYGELAAAIGFSAGEGGDAPPDREGAPLDPQAAIRAERMASAGEAFGIFGTIKNGVLAGLRQASFWLMKHRARTVGEQGMHTFVSDLQRACDANVHLMGHSFGCIVVSSILGGPGGNGTLTRPVNSVVLVQGAMSLWSYAEDIPDSDKPGYFRHLLGKGAVSGPIVTTQSVNDRGGRIRVSRRRGPRQRGRLCGEPAEVRRHRRVGHSGHHAGRVHQTCSTNEATTSSSPGASIT